MNFLVFSSNLQFLCQLLPVAILFLTNGIRLIKEAYYKRTNCGFIHYDIERVSIERYVTCSRHAITYRPQRYLYMISYQRYAYIWVFLLSSNDIPMVVFMSLNVISLRRRQQNKAKINLRFNSDEKTHKQKILLIDVCYQDAELFPFRIYSTNNNSFYFCYNLTNFVLIK